MVSNKEFEPLEMEPSDSDFRALVGATKDFFAAHLKSKYINFEDIAVSIRKKVWNDCRPSRHYNVHIEWNIEATFLRKREDDENVPDSWHLTQALVSASCSNYHKRYVRALADTPFGLTTAVHVEQVKAKGEGACIV